MNDPQGSNWRKWDLHIHSPASHIQHYGTHDSEETWEKFISDLESLPADFKVIGINDYNFIDGYKRVREFKSSGRLQNIDLILPVVELRVDKFVGTDEWRRINFHVIFSDELPVEEIQAQFLNAIGSCYQLSPECSDSVEWGGVHTRESLAELGKALQETVPDSEKSKFEDHIDVGFNNLNCSLEEINKILKKSRFKNKYITAIGKGEWEKMKWTPQSIASKKSFINGVDLILTAASTIEDYYKGQEVLRTHSVNHRLIHCSDAHYLSSNLKTPERIGNSFTWIKANPTFEGLKHALAEFDDRVFIGKTPPKIEAVKANARKYIESVTISKAATSKINTKWFQDVGVIPLNAGLVSVIGNKGSGKSALTDILGLLGNSKNQKHFSFLEKSRFKNAKDKLAEGFVAKIRWADGQEVERNLTEVIDETEAELVRYIPQRFFETICNDIAKEGNQFEIELQQVIFSHIPVTDRHDSSSLKELVKSKTAELEDSINLIKKDLTAINSEIAETEKKLRPAYKASLENEKAEKIKELDAYRKNKPPEIKKPQNKENKELSGAVEAKTLQIKKLLEQETETQNNLKKQSDLSAKYEKALGQIINFQTRLKSDRTKFDNLELPIFFNDVVSITIDTSKLEVLSEAAIKSKENLEGILGKIPSQRQGLNDELTALTERLNQPHKEFQEYEKSLAKWHSREHEIIGDESTLNSLNYFQHLIDDLAQYPVQLKILKEKRRDKSLEIYEKIAEFSAIYKSLYKAVQDFIDNDELAKKFNLEFDVSIIERSFGEKFLARIKQNVSGKFFHSGSTGIINDIVGKYDFNKTDEVLLFLDEIEKLFVDEDVEILAKSGVPELYNFIFSLEYLEPTYQLKLFSKGIEQLSPGERGHLLLVFYLLVDKDDRPLIIDQPEGNLDGQSIYETLVLAIKRAKKFRQIVIVTHNPNLAVVCDSEQFIHASINRENGNAVCYSSGALEESNFKKVVIDKLEGTPPAFDNRKEKYSFGIE
ncbi:MAG: TrlF family AAA-like ATPase [Pyrinomonadaceae bacterium]